MPRTTVPHPSLGRHPTRVGLAALLLTLVVGVRAGSEDSGAGSGAARRWQTGRAVPVPAAGGVARFSAPTPRPGSRTLVVVSSLARTAEPFPIRLTARSVDPASASASLAAPVAADPGGRRAPDLATPPLPPVPAPVSGEPPRERTFHMMVRDGDVASPSNYLAVKGTLRAVGRRVQVYVDERDAPGVGPEVLRDLVGTFDEQVFPGAARTIGQARDVDGDGRFTVLMSGWLTRLAGGRHAVDGFVRSADLDLSLSEPFSNHCDMMYLSTTLAPGPHLRTVVAHEYTHSVIYCAKAFAAGRPDHAPAVEEEGWLDEALAHLVEDSHGFSRTNLDYRVSAFLSQPEAYRLVVDDYYAADLFRSHGNRGGTYLFLRWCADRFGPGLLPALVRSPRRGVANLEAATGGRFADLYRDWSVALFAAGFDPSRPGDPAYRSLELRGPLGGWDLAGPRTVDVATDGPEVRWSSAGTASRYLVVDASPTGAAEVSVFAPPEAGLQVTAVPLPDDLARLELGLSVDGGSEGDPVMRVDLRERNGTAVRLTALSWEPLVPGPDPHAPGFRRAGLAGSEIVRAFGASDLPAWGRLASAPIPARGAFPAAGGGAPVVVKAVGTDSRGRRVAAWAVLPAGPTGSDLAARSSGKSN